MASIKEKTIDGVIWSFIDSFANQGVHFIVGIILARLLSPREFGLIGMLAIFIAVSQTFVDSGLGSSLIRKKDCTQTDYSTVFYFNLLAGLSLYLLIFLFAQPISNFYNEPLLKPMVRVMGLGIIIRSFTIIQTTILRKRIDFKLNAKITVVSSILSGCIGIWLAYTGHGVWSLVIRTLTGFFFTSLFLWLWNKWFPSLVFSKDSFRQHFGFGSKLMLSQLINTIYQNAYYLVIGKYFSAQELGFFTRAQMFKDLPSKRYETIMSRVTYPVLAQMQDNPEKLKYGYKKMIKSIMFLSFTLMAIMAAVAEPMILSLIGEQWRQSIIYLQLLSFVGMMYPLHSLNLNMLNVQGRSGLFLRLEIIKKLIAIPTIVIGVFWGIKIMIIGMMVNTLIAYYINSYYSGRHINYPMREQIIDIAPSFILSMVVGAIVFFIGLILPFGNLYKLIILLILGGSLVLTISEIFRIDAYLYIKEIAFSKIKEFRNGRR
jgi:O-antigen/teichoic acid export membrane protein